MLRKINDFLAGMPMTLIGAFFLIISFVLPRVGVDLPVAPAWITVMISGIPLLYLAVWRIIHNPGISKISSCTAYHDRNDLLAIAIRRSVCCGRSGIYHGNRSTCLRI